MTDPVTLICEQCGTPFERVAKKGAPRRYCKDACKQAAYRARQAGEAPPPPMPLPTRGPGPRAVAFRADVTTAKGGALAAGDEQLVTQACRLIDLLDRMEAVIDGDDEALTHVVKRELAWLGYDGSPFDLDDGDARVVIVRLECRGVVAERRQTVAELRQVVKALDIPANAAGRKAGGIMDELARRRAEREALAAEA